MCTTGEGCTVCTPAPTLHCFNAVNIFNVVKEKEEKKNNAINSFYLVYSGSFHMALSENPAICSPDPKIHN